MSYKILVGASKRKLWSTRASSEHHHVASCQELRQRPALWLDRILHCTLNLPAPQFSHYEVQFKILAFCFVVRIEEDNVGEASSTVPGMNMYPILSLLAFPFKPRSRLREEKWPPCLHPLPVQCCKRWGRVGIIFLSKRLTIAPPCSNIFNESLLSQNKVTFKVLQVYPNLCHCLPLFPLIDVMVKPNQTAHSSLYTHSIICNF